MEAAQLSTTTTTSNSVYGNGKTSSLCSILRCVGVLGRRDVELNMFAQASILKKGGGGGAGRSCENSSNNRWTKIMFAQAHSLLYQLVCPLVGLLFRAMVGTQPDIVQICL